MDLKIREYTQISCVPLPHLERKVRREIANSNERRRMQNINSGFDDLKELVCKDNSEKISKAGVLRQAIDYLQVLEEYNTLLIQQNRTMKKILSESDKGELATRFSSPVKRKVSDNNSRKPTKCRKISLDSDPKNANAKSKNSLVNQFYDLRSALGRDPHTRQELMEQREVMMQKHETTPSSFRDEAFPIKGVRRSLDSIIEAINQLEGEERLNSSFTEF